MKTRTATARWEGDLKAGKGVMKLGSGAFEGPFSFRTRFEDEPGTNPEELIGAAHAGCFSMAFSHILSEAGHEVVSVSTRAQVELVHEGGGFSIKRILLQTTGDVRDIDEKTFLALANTAKENCPVSKALTGVQIDLEATLSR